MSKLYEHIPHPGKARNVNIIHRAEKAAGGFNTQIAIALTHYVGSMWTAYSFIVLAIIGLLAILGLLNPIIALLVAWTSQTLIQLVLLPVIMVGQNVLGRHSELQAEEQYNTTIKSYHDLEQIAIHLDKQDEKILEILARLERVGRTNT